MINESDLSVIIPNLDKGHNLAVLLSGLRETLDSLGIRYEILIVMRQADCHSSEVASQFDAQIIEQRELGYGGALLTGFAVARGSYLLVMDAEYSYRPNFIGDLWSARLRAEVTIASHGVAGAKSRMPIGHYLMRQVLNILFSRGLSLQVRDISSSFRLYQANVVRGQSFLARDFDILQEILIRAYAEGWRIQEIPFTSGPQQPGSSDAHVFRLGLAYLRTFWMLWKLRNSIMAADYDDRAYDSPVFLQRYWQRSRFRYITELLAGQEGPVLDVGCGSSRIIGALPFGSVALDIQYRKLRYARKFSRRLVQGSGCDLPFGNGAFPCVVCSQVIEHVSEEATILDELDRVLIPGGRLILGTPDYSHWEWIILERLYQWFAPGGYADEHITHYTRHQLVALFEGRGFQLEATRYILRGELILAFRKHAYQAVRDA